MWVVEFALSSDQTMLRESLERTLARACPLARVRQAAEANEPAREVWDALVELGVPGMIIPEAFGGAGLSLLNAALVSEMLGRHVAPVPFIATSVLAPLALIGAGSEAQQREWLPELAAGKALAGIV